MSTNIIKYKFLSQDTRLGGGDKCLDIRQFNLFYCLISKIIKCFNVTALPLMGVRAWE